jgi:hypothetical protein
MHADRAVTVKIDDGRVRVPAACEPALRRWLSCTRKEVAAGERGWTTSAREEPLYRVERGLLEVPTPMLYLALWALERAGYSIQIQGWIHWSSRLSKVAERPPRGQADQARRLLDAVNKKQFGLVRLPTGWKPHHAVRLLASIFPAARIAVGAPRDSEVRRLLGRLRGLGPRLHTARSWPSRHPAPVVVGTLRMLDHCRPDDFDLLVATDALAAAPSCEVPWSRWRWLPAFALLAPRREPSERETLRLWAKFGPFLTDLGGDDPGRRMPLTLLGAPVTPARPADDLLAWRRRLWLDGRRNDLLARLARAAAGQVEKEMDELGVPAWAGPAGTPPRVVLLADSPAHGRELASLLPGWELWTVDRLDSTPGGRKEQTTRLIVTLAAAARRGKLAPDIVVNATLADVLSVPGLVGSRHAAEVQVVDLLDDGDDGLVEHARLKEAAYRRAGLLGQAPLALVSAMAPASPPRPARQHGPSALTSQE